MLDKETRRRRIRKVVSIPEGDEKIGSKMRDRMRRCSETLYILRS